jgi:hypothetical protein
LSEVILLERLARQKKKDLRATQNVGKRKHPLDPFQNGPRGQSESRPKDLFPNTIKVLMTTEVDGIAR